MVVDRPPGRGVAAVDERRLVGHLRGAGEPALLDGVRERPRRDPGRARRPEPQPGVLVQAPGILERVAVLVVAPGHRAVDLDAADRDRQAVVGGDQRRRLAVDLDPDTGLADGRAHAVPLLLHVEQLDSRLGPVGELDELRFAPIEIDGAEERLVRGAGPARPPGRPGGRRAVRIRVASCTPGGGRAAGVPGLAAMRREGIPASISLTEGRVPGNRTVLVAREEIVRRRTEMTRGRRGPWPGRRGTGICRRPGVHRSPRSVAAPLPGENLKLGEISIAADYCRGASTAEPTHRNGDFCPKRRVVM